MAEPKKGASVKDDGAMRVDAALVQELAELLTANALTEIEVGDGDRRIRVARHATPAAPPAFATAPTAAAPAAAQAPAAPAVEEIAGETVKSPMVGTAFLSAEPGTKPFVTVGDTVKAGDTLLIVEAMKVMNQITAPAAGVVRKILVGDGQPIEFDQPLIVIG
ncbi:MAG TPA: acetyl-CoA carboxylase biotin carboxyl carrier protein [Sphingomicrobium sp.]|jgi:acetyl-CoA carboxylase biotin carboxyl carrier protein|nr:acetyl-CoA carboxylase biotin carboxyl carrier protein [Sphingomicrobium sp.]